MLTGVDPPLNGTVVLLEHVIQIRHWPMPAILGQIAFGFELRNGRRIRGVAVGVDDSWRRMVRTAQRFDEKAQGRDRVLLSRLCCFVERAYLRFYKGFKTGFKTL